MPEEKQGNGEVVVDIDKTGIHVLFTSTPTWAYILVSIGMMFAMIIWAHSFYKAAERASGIKIAAEKLVEDKALSDKEVKLLETMDKKERKAFNTDVRHKMSTKIEQTTAPGTKVTIEKEGDKTTITKGGQ